VGDPVAAVAAAGREQRGDPAGDQQEPAGDRAEAGHVVPARPLEHGVQAVRRDAEAGEHEPDRDAERRAGRPRHARLGPERREWDGDDRRDTDQRRVGTRECKVEEMDRDEREAGDDEGALEACEPH